MTTDIETKNIRPAEQNDYEAISEIVNLCWPEEDACAAEELWERESFSQPRIKCARFALEQEGPIVATARYYQLPGRYHPERFWLEVDVHPLHRGNGFGSALLHHLIKETEEQGAKLVRVALDDARTKEIAFLEKRGFGEEWRSWELARTLEDVEPLVLRTEAAAILAKNNAEIMTLAEAFQMGLQRDCYRVHETTRQDSSWNDPVTEWGFENYLRSMHQNVNLEASYAAFIEGELVALCALGKKQIGDGDIDHNWTGVMHAFRGRGLARALKKLALANAKELGYNRVVTTCNSVNKPMLTLNNEFGFEKLYAWVYMALKLPSPFRGRGAGGEGLTLREPTPSDHQRICDVRNLTLVQHITPGYLEAMYASHDPSWPLKRLILESEAGELVAYTQAFHMPNFGDGVYFLSLDVHPNWRGKGIGSQLLRHMEQTINAKIIRLSVRDDRPAAMAFAQKHGYVEYQCLFESVADLTQVDSQTILARKEKLENEGIRFQSYADLGDTPENRHKLHELHNIADLDTPGYEAWGESPFETFEAHCFKTDRHDPKAILVALDQYKWISVSMIFKIDEYTYGTAFTGTLPAYRGRGIGGTLKGLAVLYAKSQGATQMRADNDTRNTPMLDINRKLGFKPEFGWRQMEKNLVRSEG